MPKTIETAGSNVAVTLVLSGLLWGIVAGGCSSSSPSSPACIAGSESCVCLSDGTCNPGLSCVRQVCEKSGEVGSGGTTSLGVTASTSNGGSTVIASSGAGGNGPPLATTSTGGGSALLSSSPQDDIPAYEGCWITYSSTGSTRLEFTRSSSGVFSGNLIYQDVIYPITNIVAQSKRLAFTVEWRGYGYKCDYDFTDATATKLAGNAHCGNLDYDITADRSCK